MESEGSYFTLADPHVVALQSPLQGSFLQLLTHVPPACSSSLSEGVSAQCSASFTLAGQRVVANNRDAKALSFHLAERNLVDLISLQVGLKQTHTHTQLTPSDAAALSLCGYCPDLHELTALLSRRWVSSGVSSEM